MRKKILSVGDLCFTNDGYKGRLIEKKVRYAILDNGKKYCYCNIIKAIWK